MLAGELVVNALKNEEKLWSDNMEVKDYQTWVEDSWVWEELNIVRNVQPSFKSGLLGGMSHGGFTLHLTRGKEPWTIKWSKKDWEYTKPKEKCKEIEYPKPDGVLSFDILENLWKSGVNHDHDQPAHLKVKENLQSYIDNKKSLDEYAGPEQRFCPARVYEYNENSELVINAQNCVHCKCCSIKTPHEFINWTVPEGGGGPQYAGM